MSEQIEIIERLWQARVNIAETRENGTVDIMIDKDKLALMWQKTETLLRTAKDGNYSDKFKTIVNKMFIEAFDIASQ